MNVETVGSSSASISSQPLIAGETRIRDTDGFVGTVEYVGPVASAKRSDELYAGIVWDDPTRGKHDGSVICRKTNQVVRHFGGCGPTQGSFLRLTKLDRGVALTAELLTSKYVELQAPVLAPNNLLPHAARTAGGKDKPIEFFGELQIRKRQQLQDIHKISLRREGISFASPTLDVGETGFGDNIQDVDLAGNLLSNWTEVLNIIHQFPKLTEFSVAYNRIRDVPLPSTPLHQLQVLNLNHCGIQSFSTLKWVAESIPNLQKLCVASSRFDDSSSFEPLEGLQDLRVLDCSDCNWTSWDDVQSNFGKLPSLEQLSLDDNPIPCIPVEEPTEELSYFPTLAALQVAGTKLQSWKDLEGINSLPMIQSIRLKNTPLTSSLGQAEVRFLTIARCPTLRYVNGSVVPTEERVEAERRYVTMVATLLEKSKQSSQDAEGSKTSSSGTSSALLLEHPQYAALREKHAGLIIPGLQSSQENGGNSTLASSVCNVTIHSMSAASCHMDPLVRRLPGSLTVGRLKALCARAFALDVDLMSLHFRTKADAFPMALDNDSNPIAYYGVCDGSEILMNDVDVDAKANEDRRIEKEHTDKILQQEKEAMAMQELKKTTRR